MRRSDPFSYPLGSYRGSMVASALIHAPDWLKEIADGAAIERQGAAFGDLKDDTELRADRVLGERFREAFMQPKFSAAAVTVEGLPERSGVLDRSLWYCVDPIDGSLDYKLSKSRYGVPCLPFASVATCLQKREGATFADVTDAGIIDLRTGDLWVSIREIFDPAIGSVKNVVWRTRFNDQEVYKYDDWHLGQERQQWSLDLGSQIVIGEMYYPENREKLARAFAGKKGYLRSFGSAAFEMALVSTGMAAAFICDRQKQHELGAGYALVIGSGGVAIDWEGYDLGTRPYDFVSQTPCILAANRRIAEQILVLLHAP